MVVIVVEAASPALRGQLSRLLIEPHAGVFVGHLSARVRDRLWERITHQIGHGSAVLIHRTPNEQGFAIRIAGHNRRHIDDYDGIQLIRLPSPAEP